MTGRCTHPEKRGWTKKRDAEAKARALNKVGRVVKVYHCPCGRYHLSSSL